MCLLETAIKQWQASSAIPAAWGKEKWGSKRDEIRGFPPALGELDGGAVQSHSLGEHGCLFIGNIAKLILLL